MNEQDFPKILRDAVLDEKRFVRAIFTGQRRGETLRWTRLTLRPVMLKNGRHIQFSFFDARQNFTYNYAGDALERELDAAFALPFQNFHVLTTDETLQARFTKKGKLLIGRSETRAELDGEALSHDRTKRTLMPIDDGSLPYLRAVGITAPDGTIHANMRNKYRQINKFLELVEDTGAFKALSAAEGQARVLDAGCGSAYLTFAVYYYLNKVKGIDTHLTGIDTNGHLVGTHAAKANALGWSQMTFEKSAIIDYAPQQPPHMVIALHACDTATDEAIAQGIAWDSDVIICAPCCHHHLQDQLSRVATPPPLAAVMRHGIMHERVGDLLTDSFRALILRIMGYKTDVVQFVEAEHTPKNLMIRALKGAPALEERFLDEYRTMKHFWSVTPYLEMLLVRYRPELAALFA